MAFKYDSRRRSPAGGRTQNSSRVNAALKRELLFYIRTFPRFCDPAVVPHGTQHAAVSFRVARKVCVFAEAPLRFAFRPCFFLK
jgi:hypothetical protein